jgi:hypothetical protein
MRNPSFPVALSDDGYGGVSFDQAAISAFAGLMTSAAARGWKWTDSDLAGANWATLATSSPGAFRYAVSSGGALLE